MTGWLNWEHVKEGAHKALKVSINRVSIWFWRKEIHGYFCADAFDACGSGACVGRTKSWALHKVSTSASEVVVVLANIGIGNRQGGRPVREVNG